MVMSRPLCCTCGRPLQRDDGASWACVRSSACVRSWACVRACVRACLCVRSSVSVCGCVCVRAKKRYEEEVATARKAETRVLFRRNRAREHGHGQAICKPVGKEYAAVGEKLAR
eukprot:5103223-Pleurochrysis_carterae.AAC.1